MKNYTAVFNKIGRIKVLLTTFFFAGILVSYGQNGCPEIPISDLNGSNGFSVEGKANEDDLGQTVKSAGDLNHDGIDDIMIGAPGVDFGGLTDVGEIYIIYGKAGLSINTFDVSTLNGSNGFVIRGVIADEKLGLTLSPAGDLNNDGTDDIIIGSQSPTTATAFVLFGSASGFLPLYTTTDLNASNSVSFKADSSVYTNIIDLSKAGDLNHDGIDDVTVTVDGGFYFHHFIVFGKTNITSLNSSALDGANGFIIGGYHTSFLGSGVTGRNAGDLNNDGIDDLVLGIPGFSEGGFSYSGRAVIWYGKSTYNALYSLDTMGVTDGAIMSGTANYNALGSSVSAAGDFNGDGIDDVIIGAPGKVLNGLNYVGEAYVLFGRNSPFPATFTPNTLTAGTAVIFQGKSVGAQFGGRVNFLKDVNNDGKDDIIIAAQKGGRANNGAAYIVFGGTMAAGIIEANEIIGTKGYQVFNNEDYFTSYFFGVDASGIGDFNADGINDFAVGSIRMNSYTTLKGKAFIFYSEKSDRTDAAPPSISCPVGQMLYTNSSLPDYVPFLQSVSDNCNEAIDLIFTQNPPAGTLFTADTNVTLTVKDKSGNVNSCSFLVKLKTDNVVIECNTHTLNINAINGKNGIIINGEKASGETGTSVNNAGDINGDGIEDFIIGAPGAYDITGGKYHNDYRTIIGAGYVVYGTASGFPANINLGLLNGTNGFIIRNDLPQNNFPLTGYRVANAGDINGDGIDDVMISDPYRHTSYGNEIGHVYVIFGKTSGFPSEFFLSALNGTNGFTLIGSDSYGAVGLGIAAVGDINGDGIDDLAAIDNGQASLSGNGNCFVIYGSHSAFPAVLRTNQINGTNGFVIQGDPSAGQIGQFVSGLGDINGDGIPDISLGSSNETGEERKFVIYGRSSNFPSILNVSALNGTNGFSVKNSINPLYPNLGIIKAGDINGDGFNDVAINGNYILFGGTAIPAIMDLKNLNGTNGFTMVNAGYGDFSGGGDFNDDGFDDYLIKTSSDFSILFGKSTWAATVNMSSLTAKDELQITGLSSTDAMNFAGDVNHDGIDDIILGVKTSYHRIEPNLKTGYAAVIFGKKIEDTEKPVITNCPANKNLAIGAAIADYKTLITVTDNCDSNPVIEQTPLPGTIYTGGVQTITLKATDAKSNFQTCSFTISAVGDILPPVLTCPVDQQLACGSLVPNYLNQLIVTDDIDTSIDVTQDPGAGSDFFDGMEIKFTAKDDAGNTSKCSLFIHTSGTDTQPPTFTCLTNVTLNCGDVIPNYAKDPAMNVDDNCSEIVHYVMTPAPGTLFYDGVPIHIEYTDESGNMAVCDFTVHSAIPDITKPSITCIGNQTLVCGSVLPDYRSLIAATDNCAGAITYTQSPAAGSVFTSGMTVTMTATDVSGNYANCSFIVNASADVTKPSITCIGNQTLNCGAILPDYRSLITASDNCDANPVITQNPVAGSIFVDGMTVTMTATDVSGNNSNCSFIVNASADVIKPSIICIGNQTLNCGAILPDYRSLITASDNCDANPVITQNPVAGSIFVDGMTITMTATDVSGNNSNCSFIVNASADVIKPVINCVGNQTLSCGNIIPDYTPLVTASDNCDASPIIKQNPAAGSVFTSGMTITITATDVSGNFANCSFIVNASADVTNPSITCIGNQNLNLGEVLPDYRSLITVSDNCDSNLTVTQTPTAGTATVDGMNIIMSAADNSGNSASCSFIVHIVTDKQAPIFTCPKDQFLACNTKVIQDYTKLIQAVDNIDPNPAITQTPLPGTEFKEGMTIEIKVSDKSNNVSKCAFQLNTNPVLVDAGEDQEITEGQSVQLEALALETGSYSWTPSGGLSNSKIANPVIFPIQTTTYTVTFKNAEGCEAKDEITIAIIPLDTDETKYGFSPNNDGINDFWEIDDITQYPNNQVLIYSRWGDLVFQTENYNNTTNVFTGIANRSRGLGADVLPEGTYFFEIRVDQPHHFKKLRGYLVLKR